MKIELDWTSYEQELAETEQELADLKQRVSSCDASLPALEVRQQAVIEQIQSENKQFPRGLWYWIERLRQRRRPIEGKHQL
jgi:hypothetical protein